MLAVGQRYRRAAGENYISIVELISFGDPEDARILCLQSIGMYSLTTGPHITDITDPRWKLLPNQNKSL